MENDRYELDIIFSRMDKTGSVVFKYLFKTWNEANNFKKLCEENREFFLSYAYTKTGRTFHIIEFKIDHVHVINDGYKFTESVKARIDSIKAASKEVNDKMDKLMVEEDVNNEA